MTTPDPHARRHTSTLGRSLLVRKVVATALAALCLHFTVITVKTLTHPSHSPLAIFRVGELLLRRPTPTKDRPAFVYEQGFPLEHGRFGSDGQQYLIVAHDPLLLRGDMVRFIDAPRYRYGRILLPGVSAASCAGQSRCIPYAILAWNLVFATMIGAIAALLAHDRKVHWGWGMVLAASGAIVCATDIATTEVCAQAFGLLGVLLATRGRVAPAAVAFACAALGRETYGLVPFGFAAAAWLERRYRDIAAYALSVVPIIGWMIYIRPRTAIPGVDVGGGVNLGFPLRGLATHVQQFIHDPAVTGGTVSALLVAVPLLIAMARHLGWLRRDHSGLALSGALFVGLGLLAVDAVWVRPGGFARGLDFLYPSLILCALARGDRFVYVLGGSTLFHSLNIVFDHILMGAPP
jgi:hypothetical protein